MCSMLSHEARPLDSILSHRCGAIPRFMLRSGESISHDPTDSDIGRRCISPVQRTHRIQISNFLVLRHEAASATHVVKFSGTTQALGAPTFSNFIMRCEPCGRDRIGRGLCCGTYRRRRTTLLIDKWSLYGSFYRATFFFTSRPLSDGPFLLHRTQV